MYYSGNVLIDQGLKLCYKLLQCIRLFCRGIEICIRRPYIINASLSLDYDGKLIKSNWGDDINYLFLKEIIDGSVIMGSEASFCSHCNLNRYLVIGSIIEMCSEPGCIIWGAGLLDGNSKGIPLPKKILAVRGPKTRTSLLNLGIECPKVYGDPAMIIPMFYSPQITKVKKLGIISHYEDMEYLERIFPVDDNADYKYIDISKYMSWRSFIDEILGCEIIASSSLHGLIMSEVYGIPNVWIELNQEIHKARSHFKYHDFYESIAKYDQNPFIISKDTEIRELEEATYNWRQGNINLQPLLDACPFPLKKLHKCQ